MRSYGNKLQKCIICIGPYKIEDHKYEIAGYQKKNDKICIHVIPKVSYCMRAHAADFAQCTLRYKVEISAKKEKKAQKIELKGASKYLWRKKSYNRWQHILDMVNIIFNTFYYVFSFLM